MTVFDLDTPHLNSGSRSEFSGATKPNSSWSTTCLDECNYRPGELRLSFLAEKGAGVT